MAVAKNKITLAKISLFFLLTIMMLMMKRCPEPFKDALKNRYYRHLDKIFYKPVKNSYFSTVTSSFPTILQK